MEQDGTGWPKWNKLTASSARMLRKRAGDQRWTIHFCKALEWQPKTEAEADIPGPYSLANKIWKILLGCNVTGADDLKSEVKDKRKKRKRRRPKHGRRRSGTRMESAAHRTLMTVALVAVAAALTVWGSRHSHHH